MVVRTRLTVRGVVQGVGFRPFVYRLANEHGLSGFVGNESAGVFIEVQGSPESVAAFQHELTTHPPPLARIDSVSTEGLSLREEQGFHIVPSDPASVGSGSVPADVGTCDDCLRELHDPADRRFRYPFVNCTHCGPRYTIIRGLPYDRPLTTMSDFPMCVDCEREYHDPTDRRFHAQPTACPVCGPHVWLEASGQRIAERDDALREAVRLLAAGAVVAVKGIGGFHLACDATNADAVAKLRERKGRGWKPFAVLVRDIEQAKQYAIVTEDDADVLRSPERPIVLLPVSSPLPQRSVGGEVDGASPAGEGDEASRPVSLVPEGGRLFPLTRPRSVSDLSPSQSPGGEVKTKAIRQLAGGVAPGNRVLGLMLPYSPLHHLLLTDRPLVMTSGNRSDEPIARDNAEAVERLAGLADAFLMHNRDIHTVCDDSVVRVFAGREYPVRRSRGYAPLPVRLPRAGRSVLAVGGELKATLCATVGDRAFLSQHIGDVESLETLAVLDRTAERLLDLFRITPEAIACDLHPGYLSAEWATRFAARYSLPLVRVQHHHAHVASLLVDAGWTDGPVLGVCFDGTGYGTDSTIWGGEFLLVNENGARRVGHLKPVPLPGGDAAIRRPYRVALAHLWAAGVPWSDDLPCVAACPEVERRVLRQQLERNLNCVPTSSAGRLFDAVAAIIGVRQEVTYEAQAAIEMESLASSVFTSTSCFEGGEVESRRVCQGSAQTHHCASSRVGASALEASLTHPTRLDVAPLLAAIADDVRCCVPREAIATRFHVTIADMILQVARQVQRKQDFSVVGLTGGVFQNVTLLELTSARLQHAGFKVFTHRQIPTNDGGLALGQAAVAAGCLRENFATE